MTRPRLIDRIRDARELRQTQGRERQRRTVTRRDGVRYEVDGRWLTNFSGNDYLGLAQHFAVVDALQSAAGRDGAGSGASHLVSGHHAAHEALEKEIADWLGAPRALLFGSGYLANLAVLQGLLGEDDVCVQDRLNHASLIDAARLAGCKLRRYPHNDAEGALRQLRTVPDGAAVVATDGVFSMDGDVAPLRELSLVAKVQQALLYVDDAHGIGVVGPDGRGCVAEAGLDTGDTLQLATLGKALGGYGACVVGSEEIIGHLAETARPYIFTTALPPAQAAATLAAVKLARRDHWRREKLQNLIGHFRQNAQFRGLQLLPSTTPIQPLMCGDDKRAVALATALEAQGYWAPAIRPPTVPDGKARLRITLSSLHTQAEVDGLVDALSWARDAVEMGYGNAGDAGAAVA
ncbi:MAG: 8-amino-7-oxononanoate synthase [Lysobacter sp.]|nr:8-amino-7-oxononanoate synthase [Lysobacter sp.]